MNQDLMSLLQAQLLYLQNFISQRTLAGKLVPQMSLDKKVELEQKIAALEAQQ